jgi:hypothetical protein
MTVTTIYTVEQLENKGVGLKEIKQGIKIKCFNKVFVRVNDFPKKFREIALKNCQNYVQSGIDSFIVESKFALTIWKEDLEESFGKNTSEQNEQKIDQKEMLDENKNTMISHRSKSDDTSQITLKKRYLQKYRGQEY